MTVLGSMENVPTVLMSNPVPDQSKILKTIYFVLAKIIHRG